LWLLIGEFGWDRVLKGGGVWVCEALRPSLAGIATSFCLDASISPSPSSSSKLEEASINIHSQYGVVRPPQKLNPNFFDSLLPFWRWPDHPNGHEVVRPPLWFLYFLFTF
jgi:hypothetical protein